jgi:ribosomal protein S18 acetylase RimI-like enzyme
MAAIRPLESLDAETINRLNRGYRSAEKYGVTKHETADATEINLTLIGLDPPTTKRFEPDDDLNAHYIEVVKNGHSFGAWEDDTLVGMAICEHETWNNTLKVWEFHIAGSHQGQGLGRALMERVQKHAREKEMRVIACETQNTNVPAIRFYRRMGFEMGAIDLSFYSNEDVENGEVAVFMKYYLDSAE